VQRASDLKSGDNISPKTITQMVAWFSRHQKNKKINPENKGTPWNDKGYVSWLLWGGDEGQRWVEKVKAQMDAADEKEKASNSKKADADGSYMSRRFIRQMAHQSRELIELVDNAGQLEDWQESKITSAANDLNAIYNSLKYSDENLQSRVANAWLVKKAQENEPTNQDLWDKVQALTKGETKSITHGGKTIQGPNQGKGFDKFPCVPVADSQALTKSGWVSYGDINVGDVIAAYDLTTGCLTWTPVEHVHHHQDAPLVRLRKLTTGFNVLCTSDHKWVVKSDGKDSLVSTKDLAPESCLITCASLSDKVGQSGSELIAAAGGQRIRVIGAEKFGIQGRHSDLEIAASLAGYHVYFREGEYTPEQRTYTLIERLPQGLSNLEQEPAGHGEVWCPQTKHGTWLMRQDKVITITGNSAYANGWASKVYKDLGGGWRKK
jgi:hypothetical protein